MRADAVDILNFETPREYLKELLSSYRRRGRGFSLRSFSHRAGFKSASSLCMVLNGKRHLTQSIAEKLADAIQLSGRRRRCLLTFAEIDTARTEEAQRKAKESLLKLKSITEEKVLELKQYRFLSIWYYPVIFVLAGMKDFQEKAAWVCERLRGTVTATEVQQALTDLVELELLNRVDGKLVPGTTALATDSRVRDLAVRSYHSHMISLAREALALPLEEREMGGLTVAIPKDQVEDVKRMVRDFRNQLHRHLSQFQDEGEVYQMNLQLFPLTHPTEGDVMPC